MLQNIRVNAKIDKNPVTANNDCPICPVDKKAYVENEEIVNIPTLKLEFKDQVSAKSSQIGSATETLGLFRFTGENLSISFNSEFVLAAVKALGSQDVVFSFAGEMRPFVIRNAADDTVVQVVTPCRPR
jgi:DNA polymerase-3 subunit beta